MTNKRLESLDVLRGSALIFIILFHSSIYNFANIHQLDFDNPPIIIILMSFMALWGGVFIIYSMVANTLMVLKRDRENQGVRIFKYLSYASAIYLFLHYILNIFLGRWNTDFVNNQPEMSFVANAMRGLDASFPHISKFFEGSSLSTIALNLLIISWVLYLLLKNGGEERKKRNYLVLGLGGFLILIFSFTRVYLYEFFGASQESSQHLLSLFYSFTLANPYPLLPYLSYGFFGSLLGFMIFDQRRDLVKKIILPLGSFFFIFGIAGAMNFEKTISTPDFFWYFKTNFELGIFLLLFSGVYLLLEGRAWLDKFSILKWFSRVSLSIYLFETFVSESLRILIRPFISGWDQTINGSLLFGLLNIFIWILILFFWKKADFKYSLEYFWVKLFTKIGKRSTKLDDIKLH